MFRNYLKIAVRTLWKHRTHMLINVLGMAVAFATSLLLFLSASFDLSFDRFHEKADRIYRPYLVQNRNTGPWKVGSMPYPLSPALKAELPEVESVTRYFASSGVLEYKGKSFQKDIRCADPEVLRIFSFPLKRGDVRHALNNLSDIVISEDLARDVFGKEDPVGKSVRVKGFGGWKEFIVSAVVSNAPASSSVTYDAFIRVENRADYADLKGNWNFSNHSLYILLKEGAAQKAFEARVRSLTSRYFSETIRDLKRIGSFTDENGDRLSLRLQPLTAVHFDTELIQGMGVSRAYVYTLLGIGLFILLIAVINFVNLTLARSFTRAREVGVRKSLGALRSQLFTQLWGEALLTCTLALLLGIWLAVQLLPEFNALFATRLKLETLLSPVTLAAILGGFGLITLVSGGYPAWMMARFPTVQVLKGTLRPGRPGLLRNGLIVTQFAVACALITSTFIVLQQIRYLRDKPLGFEEEQVISLPLVGDFQERDVLNRLRSRLAGDPNVVAVTGTAVNLGDGLDNNSSRSMTAFSYKGREVVTDWLRIDYEYLKTLNIRLLAGRDFSRDYAADSVSSVIITESMARRMGEKNPVGAFFKAGPNNAGYQVVGVVPDFHLYALHNKVEPITMHMSPQVGIAYVLVRVRPEGTTSVMETLQREWKQIAPRSEFLASFLNENTDRWYRQEERLSKMYGIAAGIAVALSCMGLFAVTLLTIEQRTKEIGVRKVLGASVAGIVTLLSKDFIKLVLLALVVGGPAAWYFMSAWLKDFPYRIDLEWWMFAATGALAVLIALATVSVQSIRAALMNPVKSLRSE
ncbi:ABC transporter permease [Larkinella soli]|uniref:ABC transporter permease n=1 Tax=Larkinella soli TaxID=1770527 RepID=UPI000FFBC5FF|nr:ABC transporter permease [Larkinella soli]